MAERIVAVGFLTQSDLQVLGTGFQRLFPVDQDDVFADLLAQLDRVETSKLGSGVVIRPSAQPDDKDRAASDRN